MSFTLEEIKKEIDEVNEGLAMLYEGEEGDSFLMVECGRTALDALYDGLKEKE